MKRAMLITLIILTILSRLGLIAKNNVEGAEITFNELSHNFGTLTEGGEKVTHLFEFTNTGTAPLIITHAKTSCRCISIKHPKRPVKMGEKGVVEVTYDPKDVGVFNKSIELHANISGGTITLLVTGEVQ